MLELPNYGQLLKRLRHPGNNFRQIASSVSLRLTPKHYGTAIALDLLALVVVLSLGIKPAVKFVSPILSNITSSNLINFSRTKHELFAFAPGWSLNKLGKVDLDSISTLSYFDLPVNSDGTLNFESSGYEIFKSEQASALFQRAHDRGVKVFITLSQGNNNDIAAILNDDAARQNIISQTVTEVKESGIDGATVDFEYQGNASPVLRGKFSQFIEQFTARMHQENPGLQLAVAIPDSTGDQSLYDSRALADKSDKMLMMASDFAVPETKNASIISPIFGSDDGSYWQKVTDAVSRLLKDIPQHKFAMETAWYGNGDDYPLYIPRSAPSGESAAQASDATPLKTPLPKGIVDNLVSAVPADAQAAARKNLPFIAKALEEEGILNTNVLAYAMATIEHETAGTFEPVDEIKGNKSARRLGYEGGAAYFGRGFIQLTHLRNYKVMGSRIGMGDSLAKDPSQASKPEVAAKILAAYFKDNNVSNLAAQGNFVSARVPINPDGWGLAVARLAWKYLYRMG